MLGLFVFIHCLPWWIERIVFEFWAIVGSYIFTWMKICDCDFCFFFLALNQEMKFLIGINGVLIPRQFHLRNNNNWFIRIKCQYSRLHTAYRIRICVCHACTSALSLNSKNDWHEIAIILTSVKLTTNRLNEIAVVIKLIVQLYCLHTKQQTYKMIQIFSIGHHFEVDSHHKRNV